MSMYNPWMVPSLNEFTFLCCPECVFRSKIATSFQTHAIQNHPKSSVLFSAVKEEPPDFTDISISFDDETKELDKEDIKELVEQPVKSEEETSSNPKRSKRKSAKKEISYEENDEFFDTPGNEDFFEQFPVKVDLDEDTIANADTDEDDTKVSNSKKKNYACAFCSFQTLKQGEMNNHIKLKHTDGSGNLPEMKCEECDKTFPSLRQLKKHRHGVHSEKQECKICGKIFNKSGYRAHIKVAHVNKDFKEFKCDLCEFSSHAWKYVKTHKLNCHETESHTLSCEKCGRRFAFPSQLKKHRCGGEPGPNDKEGGSVECPECGQELKARHYLVNHFRTNHGRLPPGYEDREKFICDHCSSIFMTEDALRNHIEAKHMNIREKILCLKCDQEFTDERYLIQHYRIVHKDIPPGFEEKEKFMCDQCPSVFFNKLSLKLHCKNKHTKGGSGASKSFHKKCPHCGKRFSSYLMWHEHVKAKHEKNTPHECDQCHRCFGTAGRLRIHKKNVHQRIKCDICVKEICNMFILKRHKASVHGITPTNVHQCEFCSSFFETSAAKDKHVEKQHGETTFNANHTITSIEFKPLLGLSLD